MPDICMCSGHLCNIKENCYRFTATPGKYQSYFSLPPNTDINTCEYFYNNGRKDPEVDAPDSRTHRFLRKKRNLSCSHCPPHRAENAGRCVKHGPKKPKYKDK